jgi:hypothetical protein
MYRNRDPTGNVITCKEVQQNAPFSITSSDTGKAAFSSNGQHMKALDPMRTIPSSKIKYRMQVILENTRASITRTVEGILMLDGSPKQHTTAPSCTRKDSYITQLSPVTEVTPDSQNALLSIAVTESGRLTVVR